MLKLPLSRPFREQVDLDAYPDYAMKIEYLMDLGLIKQRLESGFYRRAAAVLFDIGYIHKNARQFNQEDSLIVHHAHLISELCSRIVK